MNAHQHSHSHTHGNGHNHAHGTEHLSRNLLLLAVIIILLFAGIEAISGWWAKSLVLLSDAGHMGSDALALSIAAFAAWIARRPPSDQHSYGFGRAEVIAAWVSSMLMVFVVIIIFTEAIERLRHPSEVAAKIVIFVAILGLIVNGGVFWLLTRGERTLNIRAAILHVISDLLGSVAALVAGLVIYFTHWHLIDPILSIFVCLLILFSTIQLLRESLLILMEGVPPHIDMEEVGKAMVAVEQVHALHDLHIWTLTSGRVMLTAHVQITDLKSWQTVMANLRHLLHEDFGIDHITLQPELSTEILYPFPQH
ncbi:MAG: cation diffusion facilitator family transporter [Gammaproteobacteria bacterium]